MKTRLRINLLAAALIAFAPPGGVSAQPDQGVDRIKEYLSGQKLRVSYREGGALYGTHFVLEIHYCPSGRFVLFGRSEKQTVLDNWQVNNWEEYGRWDVIRVQNLAGVWYESSTGKRDFIPVQLLSDGGIWAGEGVEIQRHGRAGC